jgi:hypothetical protein
MSDLKRRLIAHFSRASERYPRHTAKSSGAGRGEDYGRDPPITSTVLLECAMEFARECVDAPCTPVALMFASDSIVFDPASDERAAT